MKGITVCSRSFVIMWLITVADLSVTRVGFVMREKAPLLVVACMYFSAWGDNWLVWLSLIFMTPRM